MPVLNGSNCNVEMLNRPREAMYCEPPCKSQHSLGKEVSCRAGAFDG